MNRKLKLLLMLLLFSMTAVNLSAQSLTVKLKNGSESTDVLNTVRKLTFSDGNLLVWLTAGATDSYVLSTVQKVYFDTSISIDETPPSISQSLHVFPNPAGNKLTIESIPLSAQLIKVFRTNGQLVVSEFVTSTTQTLDISMLNAGLYLININGRNAKFIKQ